MMLVDCRACPVRNVHCPDCMVTALTRIPVPTLASVDDRNVDDALPLDPKERRALAVLAAAGLVDRGEAQRVTARAERPAGPGSRRFAG